MSDPKKPTYEEEVREAIEKEKREEAKHHEEAIEDTFPASDPPSTTQPGSGITGPEVARERK